MKEQGVPPTELPDDDLIRELKTMYRTRAETLINGSPQALETHTDRMLALEAEYAGRFPKKVQPLPERTREGARARAGQPPEDDKSRI
jgi:hypothetical protein